MNYHTIKQMAKASGRKYTDFLSMAPQNDPFYVGTPRQIKGAEWFANLWQRAGYTSGVHLRRVHYWAVSQSPPIELPKRITWDRGRYGTDVYVNELSCWGYLCDAAKWARWLGLVNVADIVDRKNPPPHQLAIYRWLEPHFDIDLPDIDAWDFDVDGIDSIDAQPYHLEVWTEKSTMDDVLLPACRSRSANLVTFEGEVSITAMP